MRDKSLVPVCLMISPQYEEKLEKPILVWNKRLSQKAFEIYPHCDKNTKHVPINFTSEKPKICYSEACTVRKKINNKLIEIEVNIWSQSTEKVILHELGHLVGCEHSDYLPPCWE